MNTEEPISTLIENLQIVGVDYPAPPIFQMVDEAAMLLGNALLQEMGVEAAELLHAILSLRERQEAEQAAMNYMQRPMETADGAQVKHFRKLFKWTMKDRKRLARAVKAFMLRGGIG